MVWLVRRVIRFLGASWETIVVLHIVVVINIFGLVGTVVLVRMMLLNFLLEILDGCLLSELSSLLLGFLDEIGIINIILNLVDLLGSLDNFLFGLGTSLPELLLFVSKVFLSLFLFSDGLLMSGSLLVCKSLLLFGLLLLLFESGLLLLELLFSFDLESLLVELLLLAYGLGSSDLLLSLVLLSLMEHECLLLLEDGEGSFLLLELGGLLVELGLPLLESILLLLLHLLELELSTHWSHVLLSVLLNLMLGLLGLSSEGSSSCESLLLRGSRLLGLLGLRSLHSSLLRHWCWLWSRRLLFILLYFLCWSLKWSVGLSTILSIIKVVSVHDLAAAVEVDGGCLSE